MKRREFIGIAAVGATALAVPGTPGRPAYGSPPALQPRLLAILRDAGIVHRLGRRYRELVPGENSADALTRAILPDTFIEGRTAASTCRILDEQVKQDFESGRTVTLDGWLLSLTEARQCALFSLVSA